MSPARLSTWSTVAVKLLGGVILGGLWLWLLRTFTHAPDGPALLTTAGVFLVGYRVAGRLWP